MISSQRVTGKVVMKDHCGRQWSGFGSAMVAGSSEEATAVLLEGKRGNEGIKKMREKNTLH